MIYRYIAGSITPEEREELDWWLADSPENREFFSCVTSEAELRKWYARKRMINSERAADDMLGRIAVAESGKRRRRLMAVAAVAVAFVAVGLGLKFSPSLTPVSGESVAQVKVLTARDIRHGMVKATVTGADGRQICLSDTAAHTVASLTERIRSNRDAVSEAGAETKEIRVDVPRGGEFKVMLEDSTVVWLNADTRLWYPERFAADERRVKITGEAYFEVKKDPSRPFYVESEGQEVRVYGTRFNIRSYADDTSTYTTLESGSIALASGKESTSEMFMRPGSQAVLDRATSSVEMKKVDSDIVTSWRNGYFVFENQTLLNIMRDLSRWYNFDFEIKTKELENEVFMGSFPRDTDFPTAITILENCGGISFEITDNKVVISKGL